MGRGVGGVFSGVRDRGIRAGLAERPPGGERRTGSVGDRPAGRVPVVVFPCGLGAVEFAKE